MSTASTAKKSPSRVSKTSAKNSRPSKAKATTNGRSKIPELGEPVEEKLNGEVTSETSHDNQASSF